MNIEKRYQNSLGDMLTLLTEAVYRFITELDVDLSKFFQFFKQFHRNLVSLEDYFHPCKFKFSKNLTKLYQLTQSIERNSKEKNISLQPQRLQKISYKSNKSKELYKNNAISKASMPDSKTEELNVIGQIQQREDFDDVKFQLKETEFQLSQNTHKNRIGTAEGIRHKMSVTIDFNKARPYTGNYKNNNLRKSSQQFFNNQSKQRYKSLTKYEKDTVVTLQNNAFPDQPRQTVTEKKILKRNQRKSIYDLLEEENRSRYDVQTDSQFLKEGLIKLPQKKKNKNWSRWSFKINKLL